MKFVFSKLSKNKTFNFRPRFYSKIKEDIEQSKTKNKDRNYLTRENIRSEWNKRSRVSMYSKESKKAYARLLVILLILFYLIYIIVEFNAVEILKWIS
ncbi:hypothetical protein [Ichthyobacterium seriolicida]|uniref:hypothetical protein n=1 Tax=Ichthyobacterium seriolicida TaxID=242600 RepID=UPI000BBC6108|nr:hypothetical protein [Ichthyobacterium seriolicida]